MGLRCISIIACFLSCQIAFGNERECIKEEGSKLTHVREVKSNDSPEIRTILKNAGFDEPVAYCSATVKYVFDLCGVMTTITAWSPTAVPEERAVWKGGKVIKRIPKPADTWGIYSPRKGRVSHAGIVFHWPEEGNYFLSFEGNVRVGNGMQGITVLRRKKSDVYIVCNWIEDETIRKNIDEAMDEMTDIPMAELHIPEPPKKENKGPLKELLAIAFVAFILMRYGSN